MLLMQTVQAKVPKGEQQFGLTIWGMTYEDAMKLIKTTGDTTKNVKFGLSIWGVTKEQYDSIVANVGKQRFGPSVWGMTFKDYQEFQAKVDSLRNLENVVPKKK
jgi:cyclopropane fatty-acyl-phospholipid synthase-like methyltransferase